MTSLMRLSILAALLALSGCETLSESECRTGDWYGVGVRDGANGYAEDRFIENAKACQAHGIEVDRARWLEGRLRGLERYCTARNAFDVGAGGSSYAGVCTGPMEDDFLHGYDLGRKLAEARQRRDHWDSEIREIRKRLDEHAQPAKDDKPEHAALPASEIADLNYRLGVAVTRRDEADRDVTEWDRRGRQL